MPLSRRFTAAGQWTDPKQNCTHQFDAACHAITHAAWGRETRVYDIEIPRRDADTGETQRAVWVDGELRLAWPIDWTASIDPQPPFDDAPWRGGFMRWADANAARRRRRVRDRARGARATSAWAAAWTSTRCRSPTSSRWSMAGICHTMQPEVVHVALRNVGTIRDFCRDPDHLLPRLSRMALQVIAMGGYEIPGPSGPPSALERYLFAAAGVPTPRVCCLATASGDVARIPRTLLRGVRGPAVRALPSRACSTIARSTISTRSSTCATSSTCWAATPRACSAVWRGARARPARLRTRAAAARFRGRRRERGRDVLVRRGLHDVVRAAHAAARRSRLVRRQLLPARGTAGPARRVHRRASATARCRRAGRVDDGAALHFVDGELHSVHRRVGCRCVARSRRCVSVRRGPSYDGASCRRMPRPRIAPGRRRGRRSGAARRSPRSSASTATRSSGCTPRSSQRPRRRCDSTAPPSTIWKSGISRSRGGRTPQGSARSVAIRSVGGLERVAHAEPTVAEPRGPAAAPPSTRPRRGSAAAAVAPASARTPLRRTRRTRRGA